MIDKNIIIDPEERAARGVENFLRGFNCTQAVVDAFSDIYNVSDDIMKLAMSFGGGMARLRMTCGACTGMFMLAGLETGSPVPKDIATRTHNYATVQKLGLEFKEINGSMICAELLGLRSGTVEPPRPSERTAEYYKSRPCTKMIETACRIYANYLISLQKQDNE